MPITVWLATRWRRPIVVMLSTLLLCACDSPIVPPNPNPHPTKWVTIRVFAPPSLKVELDEMWTPNSHPVFSSGACNLPGGMRTPLYVPVALKWNGISYVGSFLEDRYLPSRCDWGFDGLRSFAPSDDVPVIYSASSFRGDSAYDAADRSVQLWCGVDPAPKSRRVEVCIFLSYFAKYSDHFPRAWRRAATNPERSWHEAEGFITPKTKSVELYYRDFDAEARAANANQ